MTRTIKAIETQYKGYRFRSRLEARWAVFFDALGVEWEYEPEGYDLGEAGWYLPDFWLPKYNGGTYVEVKPFGGDFGKVLVFAELCDSTVWLAEGSPDTVAYAFHCVCKYCKLSPIRWIAGVPFSKVKWGHLFHYGSGWLVGKNLFSFADKRWQTAVTAARSARFEHGETPK